MLQVEDLVAGYSSSPVLHGINLTLQQGEIVTLIGSNGAGKSTLVQCISGLKTPMAGRILFEGKPIHALPPAARLRLGIAHVPEGRQVFAAMTVAENLALGAQGVVASGTLLAQRLREVCAIFPVLGERMGDVVGNFSGGQQQMLAIGRGLMSGPKLLLLDEPSLGLSPLLVQEVFRLVKQLRDKGLTILLAEQNARSALSIADRGYVVENGRVTLSGRARDLLASPDIAERYLGGGSAAAQPAETSLDLAARLRACIGVGAPA
jgi:branched-chain amino acid transport system ATP-binding protein